MSLSGTIDARRAAGRKTLLIYGLPAIMLAAAIAVRILAPTCTDVSWLLTVGEKMLGGARAYADIVETNPPASILLYLPAILFGRMSGMTSEAAVTVEMFALALASLGLCHAILRPAPVLRNAVRAVLAIFLLLVFPAYAFAQRDHAALLLMLPMLACIAARAEAQPPARSHALLAGIGGGLALALKLHYALALALPFAYLLWGQRGDRHARVRAILAPENLMTAAVAAAYGAFALLAFPAYVADVLPMVLAVYAPVRRPFLALLVNPSILVCAATLGGIALMRARLGPRIAVPTLAGLGAAAAILVQGKGWPYHGYPAMALLLFALGMAVTSAPRTRATLAAVAVLSAALGFGFLWLGAARDTGALAAEIVRIAPPHPRIVTISPDIALGHPLTRDVGGEWIGTNWGEWVSDDAAIQLEQHPGPATIHSAMLRAYAARDRAILAHDIAARRPDVVLVDGAAWRRWAFADPGIARALAPYHEVERLDQVEIWAKAPGAP